MNDEPAGGAQAEDGGERAPSNWGEMLDERTHWRFWMPRYIVGALAERLGQRGLALYASLAWWMCADAPHHRPGLKEIGLRAGCSRSTVWRGLKELVEIGVIRIEPCVGRNGRRAHRIVLTHPPEAFEYERIHGPEVAGGANLTPPRAQDERAEVSNCARGALNLSAPSGSNLDPNVCSNEQVTHTQSAPPLHGDDLRTAAQDFSRQWVAALPSGSLSWRRDQARESAEVAEELLRAGWTLAELLADLAAADRSRREYPRAYAERHGPQALQAARRSTREAEERQKRAKAAEEAAEWSRRKADYRARFEALPADERAALEAEIRKRHKRVADHPGIVRGLAADLLGEQLERAAELLGMVDQAELPEQHAQAD